MPLKIIIFVALLGAIGGGFYYFSDGYQDRRACENAAARCGSLVPLPVDTCIAAFRKMRSGGMEQVARQARSCMGSAGSCPEIVGCGVGAVTNSPWGGILGDGPGTGR